MAQNYFNRTYDTQNIHNGFIHSIPLSNGMFFGTGTSWSSFGASIDYLSNILIDETGSQVWSKLDFARTDGGIVAGFAALEDIDKILITGPTADITEGGQDIFLYAINLHGDSLWYQNLDAGFNDVSRNILKEIDGGYLVLGYYYLGDFDSSRIIIIKTDSLGNKIWQQEYGQSNSYNFAYDWKRTNDKGLIITGDRNDNNNQNRNFLLMKIDSNFNEEWSKSYDGGFFEVPGVHSSLANLPDGFIIVGQQEYFAVSSGTHRTKSYIIKTDKQGNLQWQKLNNSQYMNEGYRGIVQSALNEYTLVGFTSIDSGPDAKVRCLLAKMDSSGNIFWQREYNHYNGNDLDHVYSSMISLSDNGDYIISGYVLYSGPFYNDAWLMRTDSCGYTEGDESTAIISIVQTQQQSISLSSINSIYCDLRWFFGDGDSTTINNPTHTYSDTGTYTITLITRAGNDYDTAYITIEVTDTGIITNTMQTEIKIAFNIMPNPASNFLILKGDISPLYEQITFTVYDIVGKEILQQKYRQGQILEQINVSQWARGMYSYRVTANGKLLKAGKVIVER